MGLKRLVKFGAVGSFCTGLQYVLLLALKHEHVWPFSADVLAYGLSAQVNFAMSYLYTWSDSARLGGSSMAKTWAAFNGVMVISAVVNGVVYSALRGNAGDAVAVVVAAAVSATINFILNHKMVLKPTTLRSVKQ